MIANQLHESGDKEDILITDNFVNSKKVTERVKRSGGFEKVYYSKVNAVLFPKTEREKIKKFMYLLCPQKMIKESINEGIWVQYDEVYYNNDDLFLYNVIFFLTKMNPNLKVYRFEEGYSSYISPFCSDNARKLTDIRNRFMKVKTFDEVFSGAFFFEPTLVMYNFRVPFLKISRQITSDLKEKVSKYFDITEQYRNIKEKWIIFEESFSEDIGFSEDVEIYGELNELLYEDMVMKLHPRTKNNRFEKLGIKTLKNDGVPWEAILISLDMSDKKFVAIASGSIINSQILLGNVGESWLLYKCINQNTIPLLNEKFQRFIKILLDGKGLKNIYIPESQNELIDMIRKKMF